MQFPLNINDRKSQSSEQSLPFPYPYQVNGRIVQFLAVEDLAMLALTCQSGNKLAEEEAKIRLLDVLEFLKNVNLKNKMNPQSLKYRVISFLEEAQQNLSSHSPKALRYSARFFAIYPLLKKELAKAFFFKFFASPPLFLQECEASYWSNEQEVEQEDEVSKIDRDYMRLNKEQTIVKKRNISLCEKNIRQLSILGLFANNTNGTKIDERLFLAQKKEEQLRKERVSKETFTRFYVYRPCSVIGSFCLATKDFDKDSVKKLLNKNDDQEETDVINSAEHYEMIKDGKCLLDYENLPSISSVSQQKLTQQEWDVKFAELREAVETSKYYLNIKRAKAEELLKPCTMCLRPSFDPKQFSISLCYLGSVQHGALTLNEYGAVIASEVIYDSFNQFIDRIKKNFNPISLAQD